MQLFTEEKADALRFDVLDATKLIPEELVPLTIVGRMVLDRKPDNFFAETEQVAFCPANVVPGIDFIERPAAAGPPVLLSRHPAIAAGLAQLPSDPDQRAEVPVRATMQRDGHMQMQVPKGRVNYEPSSLQDDTPREARGGLR